MEKQSLRAERIELTDPQLYSALVDFLINIGEQVFAVSRKFSSQRKMLAFDGEEWIGDCDNPTITDVQFLEKYKGPKTRKPGVKYTLEDWKKEADACRKRAEYWKDKFQAMEKTANSVADSMTEVLKTHEKLQLDLDTTNKNYTILQNENKVLKEGNENLRNSNDELLKSSTEAKQELGFAKLKIQDLEKERDELGNGNDLLLKSLETASKDLEIANEELKTVKSHLDLRTKGIQALEQDAKIYRHEIGLLKDTIESYKKDLITWSEGSQKQVEEFDALQSNFEVLEENYNGLQIDNKWTKVIAWVGWIAWFLCMGFIMFFKG